MHEPFTIEQQQDYPIYVLTLSADYVFERDLPKSNKASLALLDSLSEEVFWIVALSQSLNIQDMLIASKSVAGDERSVWRHPRIRQVILVTDSPMLKSAAKGFSSPIFGNLNVQAMTTKDEALTFAKSQLNQS